MILGLRRAALAAESRTDPAAQAEALTMVCTRVFGNQATITFAGSQGHFELNVYKPVIAFAFLETSPFLPTAWTASAGIVSKGSLPTRRGSPG
jgi:fumarate hydratase class II